MKHPNTPAMKENHPEAIDIVIPWVDGADPAWRQAFASTPGTGYTDTSEIRYRDWRTLRYWFRSIEQFAPWVRRIHFITWGHLPEWLDTSHPKLHVVNHRDYIPKEYLPTFSSNTIELNIFRIEGLAEHFVLFNDDTFLCRPHRPEAFFRNGLPCDMARLSIPQPSSVGHIIYNNLELINGLHRQREVLRRHFGKWFSPRYGVGNLSKTLTLVPWSFLPGFFDPHMPQAYLRSSFERAWQQWGSQLDRSCRHPVRDLTDLSHWLIRYDVLCRGEFSPCSLNDCRLMTLSDTTIEEILRQIRTQRYRMVCLNDGEAIRDFDDMSQKLCTAFEELLPEKSGFER